MKLVAFQLCASTGTWDIPRLKSVIRLQSSLRFIFLLPVQAFLSYGLWLTCQEFNLTMSCHAISPSPSLSPSFLLFCHTHNITLQEPTLDLDHRHWALNRIMDWTLDWTGRWTGLETGDWRLDPEMKVIWVILQHGRYRYVSCGWEGHGYMDYEAVWGVRRSIYSTDFR